MGHSTSIGLDEGFHSRITFLVFRDFVEGNNMLDLAQTRMALGLAFLMRVNGGWGN